MTSETKKAAVLVRGHAQSEKFADLANKLDGSPYFDLYIAADETRGRIDIEFYAKVPHTVRDIKSLGFDTDKQMFFVDYADVLFTHIQKAIPGYDYYILVEFDVELTSGKNLIEDLVRQLTVGDFQSVDLVAPWMFRSGPWWSHWQRSRRNFENVWSVLFPLVALSARAIRYLHEKRLAEHLGEGGQEDRVFCEAFVPSALKEGGFRMADLNDVVPRAYSVQLFYWGPPMLFRTEATQTRTVGALHPVYHAAEYLSKHLELARRTNTLLQFNAALRNPALPIDSEIRAEFTAKGREGIRARQPRVPPLSEHGAALAGVSVVLLPARPSWAGVEVERSGRAWTRRIGDRPIISHALDFLAASGASEFLMCGDPDWSDSRLRFSTASAASTAGQVRRAIESSAASRVLVCYGNVLSDIDLPALIACHEGGDKPATAVGARPSAMLLTLSGDFAAARVEAPVLGENRVNGGFVVLERSAVGALDDSLTFEQTLERLNVEGRLGTYLHDGFWEAANTDRTIEALGSIWATGEAPWAVSELYAKARTTLR